MGDIPELKSRDTEPYDISLSEYEATYHVAKKTLKKYVEKYISEDNAGAYTIPCELVHTLVSYSAAVPKEQSEGPTVITADLLYNFFTKYDEIDNYSTGNDYERYAVGGDETFQFLAANFKFIPALAERIALLLTILMEIDHQDKVDAMSLVLENFDSVLERLCVKYNRTPINPKKKQELTDLTGMIDRIFSKNHHRQSPEENRAFAYQFPEFLKFNEYVNCGRGKKIDKKEKTELRAAARKAYLEKLYSEHFSEGEPEVGDRSETNQQNQRKININSIDSFYHSLSMLPEFKGRALAQELCRSVTLIHGLTAFLMQKDTEFPDLESWEKYLKKPLDAIEVHWEKYGIPAYYGSNLYNEFIEKISTRVKEKWKLLFDIQQYVKDTRELIIFTPSLINLETIHYLDSRITKLVNQLNSEFPPSEQSVNELKDSYRDILKANSEIMPVFQDGRFEIMYDSFLCVRRALETNHSISRYFFIAQVGWNKFLETVRYIALTILVESEKCVADAVNSYQHFFSSISPSMIQKLQKPEEIEIYQSFKEAMNRSLYSMLLHSDDNKQI